MGPKLEEKILINMFRNAAFDNAVSVSIKYTMNATDIISSNAKVRKEFRWIRIMSLFKVFKSTRQFKETKVIKGYNPPKWLWQFQKTNNINSPLQCKSKGEEGLMPKSKTEAEQHGMMEDTKIIYLALFGNDNLCSQQIFLYVHLYEWDNFRIKLVHC